MAYRDANAEKERARSLRYRTKNAAARTEAGRRYRAENIEKERARGRAKYAKNKQQYFEYQAKVRKTEKGKARARLRGSLSVGKIVKPDRCSECHGVVPPHRLHGHHHDYSRPLDVEWLCSLCHGKRHLAS